jgi:hypothetical protein
LTAKDKEFEYCNYNEYMRSSKPASTTPRPRNGSRREGLRAVRIWIPDFDAADFRAEAHRQSLAVAKSAGQREDQNFVDAISEPISGAE